MIGDVDVPSQSEAFWQRPLGEDGYRARLLGIRSIYIYIYKCV